MNTRATLVPLLSIVSLLFQTSHVLANTSACADSTAIPSHIFGWNHTEDPIGVAVGANGYVYVADAANDQICRYSLYGIGQLCWGSTGSGDGEFNEPRWLSWNPVNGRLYVSEQIGSRIQVFDGDGNFIFSIENDTLSTDPGKFAGHTDAIATDPLSGNVWVHEHNTLDNVTVNRIQEFDTLGTFTGRLINRGSAFPPPTCDTWNQVWDMVVDSTGSIYVLDNGYDQFASAVHRVDPDVGCVALWGHQAGISGKLLNPTNIAVDHKGFVYVMNQSGAGSEVYKYDRNGSHI